MSVSLIMACAPITPLPGGLPIPSPTSMPSGSSSPGLPSPGGTPSPSPSSSGESGGSSSPSGGSSGGGGGTPSSYEPIPAGGGGLPGGGGGGASDGDSDSDGDGDGDGGNQEDAELSWEQIEGGEADGDGEGTGDWQTSNQLPGPEDVGSAAGAEADDGAGNGNSAEDTPGGADAELEGALEDFDGEILAEREIVQEAAASSGAAGIPLPDDGPGSGEDGESEAGGLAGPAPKSMPPTPAPPRPGSGVPNDVPDAKDDDIIARQLREAAMQEEDAELREKLWEEYRKYKKG